MGKKIITIVFILIFAMAFISSSGLAKEKYPSKPIRFVLTHGAGGSSDTFNRVFLPYLIEALGVPVVIDNMTGAGGNRARAYMYKQKPDGYQILVSKQPSMSGGQIVNNGKFETLKFVHIYNVAGRNYNCLAVPYDSPFKSMEDVKKASQKQAIITAGTGIGSNAYIVYTLYKQLGFNLIYVPFRSGGQAALAVAGAKTQAGMGNITGMYPMMEQKRVRILAVHGPQRSELYPDIPTAAEQGYPELALDELVGYFAPPGFPDEKRKILEKAFAKASANPKFQAAAKKARFGIRPLGSKEFFKASKGMHELLLGMKDIIMADKMKRPKKKK